MVITAMMKKSSQIKTDRDIRSPIESLIWTPSDERTLRSLFCKKIANFSSGIRLVCVKHFEVDCNFTVNLGGTADIPS